MDDGALEEHARFLKEGSDEKTEGRLALLNDVDWHIYNNDKEVYDKLNDLHYRMIERDRILNRLALKLASEVVGVVNIEHHDQEQIEQQPDVEEDRKVVPIMDELPKDMPGFMTKDPYKIYGA